jgi:hypothetical protein
MIPADTVQMATGLALKLLSQEQTPTSDAIRTVVHNVVIMLHNMGRISEVTDEDEAWLVRQIETLCNIYVPMMATLDDPRGHQEWLFARRADIEWRFWERYRQFLEDVVGLPPQVVRRLDEVTDQILRRLEDPRRSGAWDRRGMVVGQVQSGKTSNYTALICKAADAGYKLIVVLAGVHNSLRSQTQLRLDLGFLGFDTQQRSLFDPNNIRMGVGRLPGARLYHAHSLTSSAETGDFNLNVARQSGVMIGGAEPVLLVVKKNASVLRNLHKWATRLQDPGDQENARGIVRGVPLLVIDDEADHASINTNPVFDENGQPDPDLDPSRINGLIRRFLKSFEQSAYVGYTATPFANIFIADVASGDSEFGEDLFPRSFIINLKPPSNYLGPARLFGPDADPAAEREATAELPIIRRVYDSEEWLPDGHNKHHIPGSLPESVRRAMRSFILACAVRQVRGQERAHNSMLIHVTRFTAVQARVADQVAEELAFLQQRLRYGDGRAPRQVLDEFQELWGTDFAPTMAAFDDADLTPVTWDQVREALYAAATRIEVRRINGTAKDTLQYIEHPDGLSVICIGGDKLSRGLTLEGLSISYYLRASRMYDTLMQMGRWFGYRAGYTDLCRLYTTPELVGWYRDISGADEELRQMFEDMAAQDRTPADYGLGVRRHPDGLLITAAAKMRSGLPVRLSFSKSIVETVVFYEDAAVNHQNLLATESFLRDVEHQSAYRAIRGNYIWDGVSGESVVDFLADYVTHEGARKVQTSILGRYIEARIADGELTTWTVALISNQENVDAGRSSSVAGLTVGLTKRSRLEDNQPGGGRYSIRRLVSPLDESIDITADDYRRARDRDPAAFPAADLPEKPGGQLLRRIRPAERGLLLLYVLDPEPAQLSGGPVMGFAISFPESARAEESAIDYVVNNVYWKQEFGGEA